MTEAAPEGRSFFGGLFGRDGHVTIPNSPDGLAEAFSSLSRTHFEDESALKKWSATVGVRFLWDPYGDLEHVVEALVRKLEPVEAARALRLVGEELTDADAVDVISGPLLKVAALYQEKGDQHTAFWQSWNSELTASGFSWNTGYRGIIEE